MAREYMEKMGIKDTQYIIGRHFDKEHPHVHIAFNRIDNNGRLSLTVMTDSEVRRFARN